MGFNSGFKGLIERNEMGSAENTYEKKKTKLFVCVGLRFCSDTSDEQTSWETWSKYYRTRYSMTSFVLISNTSYIRGAQWRSWLRHCATSRKVAGSIPVGVIGIFY